MLFGKGWHQRVRLALGCPLLPVLLVLAVGQGAKIRDKGCPFFGFMADAAGGCIKLFAPFPDGWLDMALDALALKNGLPVLCGSPEIGGAFLFRAFHEWLGSSANGDTRLERDDAFIGYNGDGLGDDTGFAAYIHRDRYAAFLSYCDDPGQFGQPRHRAAAGGIRSLNPNLAAGFVLKTKLEADVLFARLRVVRLGHGVPREDILDGRFALHTIQQKFGIGRFAEG